MQTKFAKRSSSAKCLIENIESNNNLIPLSWLGGALKKSGRKHRLRTEERGHHVAHYKCIARSRASDSQQRMAVTYMTEDGLRKLKEELHELETVERPRVIAAIAEAREKGDLSENAEYDAAKEAQGALETKIAQLKLRLMDARVLDATDIKTDEVQILTKVRVKQRNNGQEKTFQLVTEGEANLAEGKISVTTPIAKGLMGKKVGEVAQVRVPAGVIEFEILEISL